MRIAVEGCAHGELEKIYDTINALEEEKNIKIDLLICCGDFQAVRNESDLRCMAVPEKYYNMGSFHKYYSKEKKAPVLTIFIGGNHEASNYLQELPYGGWVAPNIYYMGYCSVISIGGVKIGGMSGIHKHHDYFRGHFEMSPYNESMKRSVYHIRNIEVFRCRLIQKPLDIFLSHDWPKDITKYGDEQKLFTRKPFFKKDVLSGKLGSPPYAELLHELKPKFWFAAHLHVKFAALITHDDKQKTKFLALDKCLPHRQFLQVVEVPHDESLGLGIQYDPEWLAILRKTDDLFSLKSNNQYMPSKDSNEYKINEECIEEIKELFNNDFKVPENFEPTAPTYQPNSELNFKPYINMQNTKFCKKLGIKDPSEELINAKNAGAVTTSEETSKAENNSDASETEEYDSMVITTESSLSSPTKRVSLVMPKPLNDSYELQSAEVDNEKIPEKDSSTMDIVAEKTTDLVETGTPTVKKLKRRNASVYNAD